MCMKRFQMTSKETTFHVIQVRTTQTTLQGSKREEDWHNYYRPVDSSRYSPTTPHCHWYTPGGDTASTEVKLVTRNEDRWRTFQQ